MLEEQVSNIDQTIEPDDLRSQLCNYLKLLELCGMEEMLLAAGDGSAEIRAADGVEAAETDAVAGEIVAGEPGSPSGAIAALIGEAQGCRLCCLSEGRTKVVVGEGNIACRLMFIGEGPGADEDREGRPFVGRAGMLLTKIIDAMGLAREDVYITNVVKCRPPGNRVPEPDEIVACLPYLERQVGLIAPEVICTLGNVATQTITGERRPISEMRGKKYEYRGISVIPTYHPAACLRNPDTKKLVWQDIKKVMGLLGLSIRVSTSGVNRHGPSANGN